MSFPEPLRFVSRRTAGLMQWSGSVETADFIATSPELDPQES